MNEEEYERLTKHSRDRRDAIHRAKNHDYANEEEVLGNFKRVAKALDALGIVPNCTPDMVALIYAVLKIDRFVNLRKQDKTPANEAMEDTIDDLKNYIELFHGCYADSVTKKPEVLRCGTS